MDIDTTVLAEHVSAEFRKLSAEAKQAVGARDGRILALEKQVQDLTEAGRIAAGGGVRSIRDVLIAEKTLIDRPPMERGTVHRVTVAAKDIINASRTLPQVVSIVAGGPRIPLGVQNLIPQSNTTAGAITYLEETSFTNNAAPVAEGAAKPKSDKVFTPRTKIVETIAHYFKISRQSWDDLPQLAAQIESNGIYGLNLKVDQQILKGTGTSPQIGPGLYTTATAAASVPTGTNMIDRIFLAAAELTAAGWAVDGVVMNAMDLAAMTILKDTAGQYIYNSSVQLPRIVTSPALAAGEFLVGAFNQANIAMRADAAIEIATQNEDDFIRNMLTALAETRLALVVYQPAAFRKNGPVA